MLGALSGLSRGRRGLQEEGLEPGQIPEPLKVSTGGGGTQRSAPCLEPPSRLLVVTQLSPGRVRRSPVPLHVTPLPLWPRLPAPGALLGPRAVPAKGWALGRPGGLQCLGQKAEALGTESGDLGRRLQPCSPFAGGHCVALPRPARQPVGGSQ